MTKEQQILYFVFAHWGERSFTQIALKLAEECGEVASAVIKIPEGRASEEQLDDELGDVLIVLSQIAALRRTSLDRLRDRRFEQIKARAGA
jgi:NTP pyrophosphatase (non-canonical NTP hydrolase)